jgi:hypothetical protein
MANAMNLSSAVIGRSRLECKEQYSFVRQSYVRPVLKNVGRMYSPVSIRGQRGCGGWCSIEEGGREPRHGYHVIVAKFFGQVGSSDLKNRFRALPTNCDLSVECEQRLCIDLGWLSFRMGAPINENFTWRRKPPVALDRDDTVEIGFI